jgi:predicted component of type VI protein secretion system
LRLKFESVDTEELKNVEINFEGDRAIFKVGEGEANHYQIPNDKKLWETQFMIININGQYYIRDLGFVHTSRIKLDKRSEIQIQKGSIVDLGKVVHYHFDKAIHHAAPSQEPSEAFYLMRPSDKDYDVDTDDFPHLRARPTWVSADENVDNIQNEINVYADGQKLINSVGRSMKRDIQIKLKAVSADHCAIAYTKEKGWTITERGKDRLSSNGTFIFMKSMQQMNDHIPSDMIPLHDEMVISFVNYELKVSLLQKTSEEVKAQEAEMQTFFANKPSAPAPPRSSAAPSQPPITEGAAYTAEVQPNAEPAGSEAVGSKAEPTSAAGGEQPPAEESKAEAPRESTEEEFAQAATKIGAVYRGKKAREEVA